MSRRVAARLRGCDAPSPSPRPKPPALICGIMRGTSGAAGIQGEQNSGSANVVRTGRSVCCLRAGFGFISAGRHNKATKSQQQNNLMCVTLLCLLTERRSAGGWSRLEDAAERGGVSVRAAVCGAFCGRRLQALTAFAACLSTQDHRLLAASVFFCSQPLQNAFKEYESIKYAGCDVE